MAIIGGAGWLKSPCLILVVYIWVLPLRAQSVRVIYEEKQAAEVLCVGCSAEISVRLVGSNDAILGRTRATPEGAVFRPALPFDADLTYEMVHRGELVSTFSPGRSETEAPLILGIYPQDSLLPVNLLKMHVAFSKPMSHGNSYPFIHFVIEGQEVHPLLEMQPELWNEDHTVLTLWLDPGRIKRELLRQQQMGTPLKESQRYSITIDPAWRDRAGQPLMAEATKEFVTVSADRQQPDPSRWQLQAPAGPDQPLQVTFDEPLDFQLLHHAIYVQEGGSVMVGDITLADQQRVWRFQPSRPWQKDAHYQVVVESRMEDLAGNNLWRLFDRDLSTSENSQPEDVILTFELVH